MKAQFDRAWKIKSSLDRMLLLSRNLGEDKKLSMHILVGLNIHSNLLRLIRDRGK